MYKHKNGLELRKLEYDDVELLKELKDESWFGTHTISIVNLTNQYDWFENIYNSKNDIILMALHDKRPIGLYKITNIDWISRHYDSGHDVFKEVRGMGWGYKVVEAGVDFGFEILNMHRIDTEVLTNNIASHKTIIFGGFVLEGTRREAVHKCGEWIDSNFYGILYEDWINLDRVKKYEGCCNLSYNPKE
jgi:RimJ/RimL family protein N-acetyltransferase